MQTMQTTKIRKPKGYGACPTHFFAACRTASQGGTNGYGDAGYQLASHMAGLSPHDLEDDAWLERVAQLAGLLDEGNDDAVLAWLERWVPRCLSLVPCRRRSRS